MTKAGTQKILSLALASIGGLILLVVIAAIGLFYMSFIRPNDLQIAEAKTRAAYLLAIQNQTGLKKAGEAGMSETIGNTNHCYTYAFQGTDDFMQAKEKALALLSANGYTLDAKDVKMDLPKTYIASARATDGWWTQLQVLADRSVHTVASGVIDNPVSVVAQPGTLIVSGQVCHS